MNFDAIKDDNGTSLKSYVETLQEKATAHDLFCTIVFAGKEGSKHEGIHAISAIDGPPQRGLLILALTMYGLNLRQINEVLSAIAMLEKRDEDPVITPVSPGKAN